MKKMIAMLTSLMLMASGTAFAAGISDWAKADYDILSKSGMLTKEILAADLKKPIKREEVAAMMVNFYIRVTGEEPEPAVNPFSDTDNGYVVKAFSAGIVSGKSENTFDPEGAVTRQEFAKILLNTFESADLAPEIDSNKADRALSQFDDGNEVADWAKNAFYVALDNGIINGISKTQLSPKGGALREQAICIISRAYKKFADEHKEYPVPEFSSSTLTDSGDIEVTWKGIKDATKYYVIVKDEKGELLESFQTRASEATFYGVDYSSGTYSLTVGAYLGDSLQTFSLPTDFSVSIPIVTTPSFWVEDLTLAQKELRVFPDGVAFTSAEAAKEYMTEVIVPVWRIGADGEKYSVKVEIEVNSALADDVVSIFTEIFNSPEQFPIKAVGGYTWRNSASGKLSQHSYGTCIDINPNENYYVRPDGTPITGEYWKPYEDPYSMPEDGIVVKTFAKYGWEWGGNCWSDAYSKDYMHFTYLGK